MASLVGRTRARLRRELDRTLIRGIRPTLLRLVQRCDPEASRRLAAHRRWAAVPVPRGHTGAASSRSARLPAPAVVVLARDRLAVSRDSGYPVIVIPAVLARLVASPLIANGIAAGRPGRGLRRRCHGSWCRPDHPVPPPGLVPGLVRGLMRRLVRGGYAARSRRRRD
jgi:hypothetical protein